MTTRIEEPMTIQTEKSTADREITPFRIAIPEATLRELRDRLAGTRWPPPTPGAGWERGVPADYLERLAGYWRNEYDWREHEQGLNALPQFTTTIDGQRIHFLHIRSPQPGALPLILTHGYPGSFVEFTDLIGPLTDPGAHDGDRNDAFHLVIPSLPGFGFSTPVTEPGWDSVRTARAWVALMHRLGYDRYVAQGGDIGAAVTGMLGAVDPGGVLATHVNSDPLAIALVAERIGIDLQEFASRDELTEPQRERARALAAYARDGRGYLELQSTRPWTIAYALADSPVAQLAWIVEKFKEWTDPSAELPEDAVDRDRLLTIVSLYWLTGTGASAASFLYESAHSSEWLAPAGTPQGWAMFAADDIAGRLLNPSGAIEHWTEYATGGHFAAMEAPALLIDDIRSYFRAFR